MAEKNSNTFAKNSKTNDTKFSIFHFQWSLWIFITGLIVFVLLSMLLKTYNFIPPLISTIIPLLILVIKIEFDEFKDKKEQLYIGRNFLLAYAIEINDLQLEFRNNRIVDKTTDINTFERQINNNYENMLTNKTEMYHHIDTAVKMVEVIDNRREIHGKFKDVLKRMLKHSELVFTDEQYHQLNMIQYNYMFGLNNITEETKKNIKVQHGNFHLFLDNSSFEYKQKAEMYWPDVVKEIKKIESHMDIDRFIQNQISALINTLKKYDPIGDSKSKV
ncbi:hypothetical protein [Staphylococcus shinii]|uniref:hypothetical protein n=1 Tax=Staphylococcus shinii TaxID=2912228 RepID=UPI00351286FB